MRNLLNQWHNDVKFISSPLLIKPLIQQEKTDYIYDTLLSFLGEEYFRINQYEDKPIEKISWLFSLLTNSKHLGSVYALYEIAELMTYSKTLIPTIQQELKYLKKNPQNLRTFFFELYTYRLLDINGISNNKKPVIGNQPIEGTCNILNTEFLFECRKVFMPNILELDVLRRLMMDFVSSMHNKMEGGIGMICTIRLNRPIVGKHRSSFHQKIQDYFSKLNSFKGYDNITIDYTIEDEMGIFKAVNYTLANLIEIQAKHSHDLLFYIIPPVHPIPNTPNHYQAKLEANFSVYESQIYKKLAVALKEKKNQHRNSVYKNKIIFLDNEIFPEFHMGLFNGNLLNIEKVKEVYSKLNLMDILCIITRDYSQDKPIKHINLIYKPEHRDYAQYFLKKINAIIKNL